MKKKNQFRLLNEDEVAQVKAIAGRKGGTLARKIVKNPTEYAIAYSVAGNFYTAVLFDNLGNLHFGSAKRNPKDAVNPVIGKNLALVRAVRAESVVEID